MSDELAEFDMTHAEFDARMAVAHPVVLVNGPDGNHIANCRIVAESGPELQVAQDVMARMGKL